MFFRSNSSSRLRSSHTIQVGWQPLPEGGTEYLIQLDTAALDALRDGLPLHSDILPEAGTVRSYRIFLGSGPLKREAAPTIPAPKGETPKSPAPSAAQSAPSPETENGPDKPWPALTLALLGLFASLGANVFLGWLVVGMRRRPMMQGGTLHAPRDAVP